MRRKITTLQAFAIQSLVNLLPLCVDAWSPNYESEALAPASLHLHLRQQEGSLLLSNQTTVNSTLQKAVDIVTAAQEESRARNARLLANPRTNNYAFRVDSPSVGSDPTTGTAVNKTVADAAALVAEVMAKNSSLATRNIARQANPYWMAQMTQNGKSPYVANQGYKVWRSVKDYGAIGDGVADDTVAINNAITDGNRCGLNCGSTSTLQAVIYFPPGTYLVSGSIVQYYFTQFIGDAVSVPTIKVSPSFVGLGVISTDVYIDGGDGAEWYINQSNFFRQVRNFIIDMTLGPPMDQIAGIHWQVAQATSLQNIKFVMSTATGNNQQGIFMENGSGGFMGDLEFIGGALGIYVGNQQFTVRNLKFSNHLIAAITIQWDWGWTWKGITILNSPIAVIMSTPKSYTEVGSAIFLDSSITNCPIGWQIQGRTNSSVSLSLFNVQTNNVPTIVEYDTGATLLAGSGGSTTVAAWGLGKRYDTNNGEASGVWQDGQNFPRAPVISSSLLQGGSTSLGFFGRSKPQYETLATSQFVNVKLAPYNAKGNGVDDDTAALNSALTAAAAAGKVVWIPAGVYLVTDTVTVPGGSKVVGQSWSQIMGAGTKFSNIQTPQAVVRVGNVGDVGSVELQDLLFTVRGATAGAIVLEWNIHESSPGSAAMWDCHIRVGGALGSNLQAGNCPKLTGTVNPNCMAASLLVRITSKASAYFENTWFWVADHDLDIPSQDQIDIYSGRGFLIESTGPVWLYGTASEHSVLYQYQTVDASNIFMGMIQTESPYFQTSPPAPGPFTTTTSLTFPSDPSFDFCQPSSPSCAFSWGLRLMNSQQIFIYGAGLYSWFQKYTQDCVDTENCQDRITYIEDSGDIWFYSLITKASVEMISPNGGVSVLGEDNKINYCDVVMAWLGGAGAPSNVIHRSPISATVIPFSHTTVAATATFTIGGPVVTDIDWSSNDGNQNQPVGPGASTCLKCDLMRLITSTCCGIDGSIGNPIVISPSTPIPRSLILPAGFVPNQQIPDDSGNTWPPGQPLPHEVTVPIGTTFLVPFLIPPGLAFSNDNSDNGDDVNGTLYLPDSFWDGPHTVSCYYPCTIFFPPIISSTLITFPPITTTVSSDAVTTVTTIFPPVQTTEQIRISSTTVSSDLGSQPTKVILPLPALKPLCIKITIPIIGITIQFGLCPPTLSPFPPPVPQITIVPVPPGRKPGPSTTDGGPTKAEQEEEDEEEEEEEDGQTCPWVQPTDGEDDLDRVEYDDEDIPGSGGTDPGSGTFVGVHTSSITGTPAPAGTGSPGVFTVTVTTQAPEVTVTSTVGITETRTVTPIQSSTLSPPPVQPTPNPDTEVKKCYGSGLPTVGDNMVAAARSFCSYFDGKTVSELKLAQQIIPLDCCTEIDVGVISRNNCAFTIEYDDCWRILKKIADDCKWGLLRIGGTITDNCGTWYLDPNWG